MKQELLKKGDQVTIKSNRSASQFNKTNPYKEYPNWKDLVFTIEGSMKLVYFNFSPNTTHAYLLTYKGKEVGYIYNTGIELYKPKWEVTASIQGSEIIVTLDSEVLIHQYYLKDINWDKVKDLGLTSEVVNKVSTLLDGINRSFIEPFMKHKGIL